MLYKSLTTRTLRFWATSVEYWSVCWGYWNTHSRRVHLGKSIFGRGWNTHAFINNVPIWLCRMGALCFFPRTSMLCFCRRTRTMKHVFHRYLSKRRKQNTVFSFQNIILFVHFNATISEVGTGEDKMKNKRKCFSKWGYIFITAYMPARGWDGALLSSFSKLQCSSYIEWTGCVWLQAVMLRGTLKDYQKLLCTWLHAGQKLWRARYDMMQKQQIHQYRGLTLIQNKIKQ